MPHRIKVFSAGCPLCKKVITEIEVGKCSGCELKVYNIAEDMADAERYGVRVVPTTIIDDEVLVEGIPNIPFICSEETYAYFRQRYPMRCGAR